MIESTYRRVLHRPPEPASIKGEVKKKHSRSECVDISRAGTLIDTRVQAQYRKSLPRLLRLPRRREGRDKACAYAALRVTHSAAKSASKVGDRASKRLSSRGRIPYHHQPACRVRST